MFSPPPPPRLHNPFSISPVTPKGDPFQCMPALPLHGTWGVNQQLTEERLAILHPLRNGAAAQPLGRAALLEPESNRRADGRDLRGQTHILKVQASA